MELPPLVTAVRFESEAEASRGPAPLVKTFSAPSKLVLDPFSGLRLDTSCDSDPVTALIAVVRRLRAPFHKFAVTVVERHCHQPECGA